MRIVLALVVIALAAGCTSPPSEPAAPPAQPPPPEPEPAPPEPEPQLPIDPPTVPEPLPPSDPPVGGAMQFETNILNGEFQHRRITAAPGITVRWTNLDSETHSVVSADGTFAGSGPISPGGEFTRTFLTPGEHFFMCRYHGDMNGVVVIA